MSKGEISPHITLALGLKMTAAIHLPPYSWRAEWGPEGS